MRLNISISEDKYVLASLIPLVIMLITIIVGGSIGQIVFSYATVAFIVLYLLIGTQSSADRYSGLPFKLLAAGLTLILSAALALLWFFHFQNPAYADPIYWFGFPRATAIVIYLLWMPPALYLMFSYLYLFEKYIWNESQAEEFRRMNRVSATVADGGEESEE